ncbi:MAG: YeeE/YedE family protein [Alphaproteobacteria bacterium]|nr:YeeE/YedE family protein [Alphaproteobacteria bacterium]
MAILVQFAIGLVFGLGLVVAGMSDPAKVLDFLDVAAIASGGWDASLAFVMAGAIVVALPGYRLVLRRRAPLLAERFQLPTGSEIDAKVVAGPAIFGIGWGLAGICPGPAFALLASGGAAAWVFVAATFAGMAAARGLAARRG